MSSTNPIVFVRDVDGDIKPAIRAYAAARGLQESAAARLLLRRALRLKTTRDGRAPRRATVSVPQPNPQE